MIYPMPGIIWQTILFNKQKLSKMKKLVGMKRNNSSLENRKINRNELKLIQGAGDYSYIATDGGSECYDKQTWRDSRLESTLYVGNC